MSSSLTSLLVLVLSLSSVVLSDTSSFQKLELPESRSGPESFAIDSTGKGFYTGVSGGMILKYTPETGFVKFAYTSDQANSTWCAGATGSALMQLCGSPAGLAFSEKTGELYVADAPRGLYVVPPGGALATKITDSANGKPFVFLDGLDVDPTTGVVYFTSFSSVYYPFQVLAAVAAKDSSGKLFKYDPATKDVTVLMEGLSGSGGCVVSADGSFVLVSQFIKSKIQRYWIKGPKAGKVEEFPANISSPNNIRRIGSTGNFWVASVTMEGIKPTNPKAVKVDSDGKILQTIDLKDQLGDTLVSEANESNGLLYAGSGYFAIALKL